MASNGRLRGNLDVIFDSGHTGRCPSGALRFIALGTRTDRPFQDDFAFAGLNTDLLGVDFSVALECLFNSPGDTVAFYLGLYDDLVRHTFDGFEDAHRMLRGISLVIPLNAPLQRDESITDCDDDGSLRIISTGC